MSRFFTQYQFKRSPKYSGHVFVIIGFRPGNDAQVKLACISDPNIKIEGYTNVEALNEVSGESTLLSSAVTVKQGGIITIGTQFRGCFYPVENYKSVTVKGDLKAQTVETAEFIAFRHDGQTKTFPYPQGVSQWNASQNIVEWILS